MQLLTAQLDDDWWRICNLRTPHTLHSAVHWSDAVTAAVVVTVGLQLSARDWFPMRCTPWRSSNGHGNGNGNSSCNCSTTNELLCICIVNCAPTHSHTCISGCVCVCVMSVLTKVLLLHSYLSPCPFAAICWGNCRCCCWKSVGLTASTGECSTAAWILKRQRRKTSFRYPVNKKLTSQGVFKLGLIKMCRI